MELNKNNSDQFLVLGNNQDFCLLTGDNVDVTEFRSVDNPFGRGKIAVGLSSCGLFNSNYAYIWGKLNRSKDCSKLRFEFDEEIQKIKIGDSHLLILTENGKVFSFGEGTHGELGLAEDMLNYSPCRINLNIKIRKVYTGVRTSFLIDENQNLFCFGSNKFNELGLVTDENKDQLNLLVNYSSPTLNSNITNVISVKSGLKHSLFITINNKVYGSGDNSKGVLGFDTKNQQEKKIKNSITVLSVLNNIWEIDFDNVKKISCGWNNTFVLLKSGELYSCGFGKFGQLGILNEEKYHHNCIFNLTKITFENTSLKIEKFYAGTDFFFAIDSSIYNLIKDKNIYSWGWNEHYNLGLCHNKNVFTPVKISSSYLNEFISENSKVNIY